MQKKITLALTAALLAAGGAQAATLTVANGNDSGAGSLRQALADANASGDTIAFAGGVARVALLGQLAIGKNVTIDGPGVMLDGQLKGRVVLVQAGATATLRGLTITHGLLAGKGIDAGGTAESGSSWGAGIRNEGTLTLDGVKVVGNYATGGGGTDDKGGGGGGSGVGLSIGQPGEIKGAGGGGGSGDASAGGGSGAIDAPTGGSGIFGNGGSGSNGGGAGGEGYTGGGSGGGGGWAGGGGGGGRNGAGGGGYGGGGGGGNNSHGGGSNGSSGGTAGAGSGGAGSAGLTPPSSGGGGGGYAALGGVWVGGGGGGGLGGNGASAGGAAAGGIYNAPGAQLTVLGAGCTVSANLAAGGGGGNATAGGQAVGGLWNDGQLAVALECANSISGNAAGAGRRGWSGSFDRADDDLRNDKLLQVAVLSSGGRVGAAATPAPTAGQIANCTSTSGACQASYFAGGAVTLTATPTTGFHLLAWGGACSGSASTCTVTVDQARSVTASFAINTYSISATAVSAEGGSVTCPSSANHGSSPTCTASAPNAGFAFTGFTGCDSVTGSTCTLSNITGPRTVVARYAAIASVNGNTVPASGTGGPASASIDNGGGPLCRFDPAATAFGASGATPAGKMAPQGAFRFKLIGCNPGATVRVTTVWPLPVADFTKFSRGAFLPASHFTISGNTVSFDVTDGGLGDDDGQQNGEIVDPAMPLAARGGATAIPTLGEWGLLVLSALLGTLGWRRRSLSAR